VSGVGKQGSGQSDAVIWTITIMFMPVAVDEWGNEVTWCRVR
jgi:hypothetical protein